MTALDEIWEKKSFQKESSYTKTIGIMLQPHSSADFGQHPEFDEAFRRWTQRDKFRGLDLARIWGFALNCKQALTHGPGSVAELGVYGGQSSALLSLYAEKFGRKMYLCDTFNGFAEEQFEADMGEGKKSAFKDVDLETVKSVVGTYSGNRWVVGMFPNSVTDEMRADKFAFVSIDCDIYAPIKEGLRFFWPRMEPGGMIFVHDYASGYWPGATRAVDEFCSETGIFGSILPDLASSYVLCKSRAT
jgi:hypothetical protein